jgi:hypothetical protein
MFGQTTSLGADSLTNDGRDPRFCFRILLKIRAARESRSSIAID